MDETIIKPETFSFKSCLYKQDRIKKLFSSCSSSDEKYQKIIEIGRSLSPFPADLKLEENIVKGCQSLMYLSARTDAEGRMLFQAGSEALISSGLAALLIKAYHEEPPEVVLKCPPRFLQELGIYASLTIGRANGLASLFLKMKNESLKFLIKNNN